jgi:hypothetical protein
MEGVRNSRLSQHFDNPRHRWPSPVSGGKKVDTPSVESVGNARVMGSFSFLKLEEPEQSS